MLRLIIIIVGFTTALLGVIFMLFLVSGETKEVFCADVTVDCIVLPVTFVISHLFIAIEARVGVTVVPMSRVGEAVRAVWHPVADSIDWVFNVVIVKDIHSTIVAVEFIVYSVTFVVSHLRKAVYARIWVTVFL
jgi:uncharacterized membrane protein YpjA